MGVYSKEKCCMTLQYGLFRGKEQTTLGISETLYVLEINHAMYS